MKGLIAKKVGMTQVFDENGNLTPVTVIRVEPNTVVATKTEEKCGYNAIVLGLEDLKANKASLMQSSFLRTLHQNVILKNFAILKAM